MSFDNTSLSVNSKYDLIFKLSTIILKKYVDLYELIFGVNLFKIWSINNTHWYYLKQKQVLIKMQQNP